MARSGGCKTLYAIVLALYTLFTLSSFVVSSAAYLYTARLVDSVISASEILMLVSVSKPTSEIVVDLRLTGPNPVWLVSYISTSSSAYGSTLPKSWPFLSRTQSSTLCLLCDCTTHGCILDGYLGRRSSGCGKTADVSSRQ